VILLVLGRHRAFFSIFSLPVWLLLPGWVILLASAMRRYVPPVVVRKIRRADFFRFHLPAREEEYQRSRPARAQLRAKGESAPHWSVTERAARSTPNAFRFKLRVQRTLVPSEQLRVFVPVRDEESHSIFRQATAANRLDTSK